ncbi:MAG: FAD-binding oxidoreductase [Planctomycetes bacterium]|nr:FAD-binding oxidoreductase [Planctomycetota bacterium]
MTTRPTHDATDFEVTARTAVASEAELRAVFAGLRDDDPPIRIAGHATQQDAVAAPDTPVHVVSLAPMRRILRLEPDDLTCSVEAGLPRADLDAALRERGLWLPCDGDGEAGSLGAQFAIGRIAPEAPGPLASIGARAVLLGMRAMLAEGKAFASGARVVKNVAGFDVHRLLAGSRGRLFAALELHLKLRTLPRATASFATDELEFAAALRRFDDLRLDSAPPARLWLARSRDASGFVVRGRYDGAARVVADRVRRHQLEERTWRHDDRDDRDDSAAVERVGGAVPPSRIAKLVAALPSSAPVRVSGSGSFVTRLGRDASDALLLALPALDGHAEIERGARARRGRGTPLDPGAVRVHERVRDALDPRRRLR